MQEQEQNFQEQASYWKYRFHRLEGSINGRDEQLIHWLQTALDGFKDSNGNVREGLVLERLEDSLQSLKDRSKLTSY